MTFTVSATASTDTTVTLAFAGLNDNAPSNPTGIYLQVSPRADFQFCVCPIYPLGTSTPIVVGPMNQTTSYFIRARRRYGDGSVDAVWSAVIGVRTQDTGTRVTTPSKVQIDLATIVIPEPIIAFVDQRGQNYAGFPMENLTRDSPVAWRAISSDSVYQVTFNTAAPIDTIALLQTSFNEASTVIIRGGFTPTAVNGAQGGTAPPFVSSTFPFRASALMPGRDGYHGIFRLPSVLYYPWWSITITGAQIAGMCHAEHLITGVNLASKNHSVDKNEAASPLTTVSRNRSGLVDRVFGRPMRKVDFDISMLTEAQYETLYARLWQQQNNPILVVPNSKSGAFLHDRILYGDLAQMRAVNPASPRYSLSLSVNSII